MMPLRFATALLNTVARPSMRLRRCKYLSFRTLQQLGCFNAEDTSWEWLKDQKNSRLQRFLKLEQNYLANQLSKPKFRKVERTFNIELRNRLARDDFSIPECIGKYEYFMRQAPGENFPVYYRRLRNGVSDPSATLTPEEIVLNQNAEPALNHEFHFVTAMKVSPDARQLLLVVENDREQCQVVLKELESGKLQFLANVPNIKNVEWSSAPEPHRVFYFTKVDAHGRPFAVYSFDVATHAQRLIYEEQDKAFYVDVSQTKDAQFVLVNCNSKNTSEIYALQSHDIQAQPQCLRKREPGVLYFADHAVGQFYVVTNADGALNYKIATCKWKPEATKALAFSPWKVLIPEHEDVKIEDVDLFEKYLVLYERVHSVPRIRVCALGEENGVTSPHFIPLPKEHEICRVSPGINRDYQSHCVRFQVSTPLVPEIVFEYEMKQQNLHVLKETQVTDRSLKQGTKCKRCQTATPSFCEPRQFLCQRIYVVPTIKSPGVKIPLTLIHRRNLVYNGQNPTLLIGYGAYGTNLEADFELEHLSLIERGWVIALAHVRGGGELGLQWYHSGKKLQKCHSFEDYVSCTQHLFDIGVTNPKRLAGKGVSAGGLIMGYVANAYPQLYQALIMKVPFVDILATMEDATLPLTIHEYDEWGDPREKQVREYIRSYAPCENVVDNQVYPAMFVTGSINDQRVQFWEPAKWMYQMRKVQSLLPKRDKRLMMLKMTQDEGHFGGGGRLEQLEESAMEIAFLYQALKLPISHK